MAITEVKLDDVVLRFLAAKLTFPICWQTSAQYHGYYDPICDETSQKIIKACEKAFKLSTKEEVSNAIEEFMNSKASLWIEKWKLND